MTRSLAVSRKGDIVFPVRVFLCGADRGSGEITEICTQGVFFGAWGAA
jgi:hypothetical protein